MVGQGLLAGYAGGQGGQGRMAGLGWRASQIAGKMGWLAGWGGWPCGLRDLELKNVL